MNIFFLHLDPKKCAKYYFNKHYIKIILEIAQILYTAHHVYPVCDNWIEKHEQELKLSVYKKTHYNHPIAKWTRQSKNNYEYACIIVLELCYNFSLDL